MSEPQLSAVVVIGGQRERAYSTMRAIAGQTAAEAIELVVVDLDPQGVLPDLGSLQTSHLVLSPSTPWGSVRAAGVRAATSPVVAFLEDHCSPTPGWAEALLEAHGEPWASVGYAFLPPGSGWSNRATLMAEYGFWAHPAAGGQSSLLPGNNISYKRHLLLAFGEELDSALTIDNNVQSRFASQGLNSAVEPRALVRHYELDRVSDAARANYHYNRLLAVGRVRDEDWARWRRGLYAIAVPFGTPVLRAMRLVRTLRNRRPLWLTAASSLPAVALVWIWSGIGQSMGCLFGPGNAERRLVHWELRASRTMCGVATGTETPLVLGSRFE